MRIVAARRASSLSSTLRIYISPVRGSRTGTPSFPVMVKRPAPIEWSGGDVSLGMGAVPA